MSQFLDNDSCGTCQETRRDAEQNHETAVGHVGRTPCVELVNPSVELVFKHGFSCFKAAKIGKSIKQSEKKQLFPYFRNLIQYYGPSTGSGTCKS